MKKIKADDFKTPKEFQDEYFPIATPLNTELFKETEPCLQKVPEPEPCFTFPQIPSPIPTLSPIPEPQTNYTELPAVQTEQPMYYSQTNYTTIEQKELPTVQTEQPLYEQLLEQNPLQNFLTQTEQPLQHFLTQTEQQCEQPLQHFLTQTEQQTEQQTDIHLTQSDEELQRFLTQTETIGYEEETNEVVMKSVCGEETNDVVMNVITEVLNNPIQHDRTGKNIAMLKHHYLQEKEEEEEEEEEEKEELRTTTKNNKRFHKYLILKKKDEIVKKFPILTQKNNDLIVTAENKFKELKSIFVLKKKYIEKNKQLKEHIYGLELIEHRYRCETERLNKKK